MRGLTDLVGTLLQMTRAEGDPQSGEPKRISRWTGCGGSRGGLLC